MISKPTSQWEEVEFIEKFHKKGVYPLEEINFIRQAIQKAEKQGKDDGYNEKQISKWQEEIDIWHKVPKGYIKTVCDECHCRGVVKKDFIRSEIADAVRAERERIEGIIESCKVEPEEVGGCGDPGCGCSKNTSIKELEKE